MLKYTVGLVAALAIADAPMLHAEGAPGAGTVQDSGRLSQTEFKILTETRIAVVKIALQLTPEQQQYWPPVEEAIRDRSEARYRQLRVIEERASPWRDIDPVQFYRNRAAALTVRADGLRKLADAWQPLYQSLTPEQRMRLRLVTVRALEGVGAALERRQFDLYDDAEFSDLEPRP